MTWMRFRLTLVLVLVATVFTAVVQGRMSHRWGTSERRRQGGGAVA